jgi:ABC-type antimicrobial peptide transport system ATPase subunit
LEFVEVRGSHVGEDLAKVVKKLCIELSIRDKLFTIIGDNASNNSTLCQSLYTSLKR